MKPKSSPSKSKKSQPASTPLEFWDAQAKEHGASDLATNPDQHYRKLEIESILRVMANMANDHVLDVGCGNGHTTFEICSKFPHASVIGVDFSKEMIRQARLTVAANDGKFNVDFEEADVLALSRTKGIMPGEFDVVISTRCLINLANWEEQKIGILEMRKMLAPGGRLILVENFQEGLDNLNSIRKALSLPEIKTRWHNQYLPMAKFKEFLNNGLFSLEYSENIGNFYYLASRVINAKIAQDQGREPDYNDPINKVASQMPTLGEYYAVSPNYLIILKNREQDGQTSQGLPQ